MLLKDKVKLWRDRFHGRQEVFGTKNTFFSRKLQKMVSIYNPIFREKYITKESRDGVKFTSPEELYVPLNDGYVENHITGTRELLMYVLQMDGTINFAAFDFDSHHTFEDVLDVKRVLDAHFIPHGIARSTSKGHHIYIFFDKPLKANYWTSYVDDMYEEIGFNSRLEGTVTKSGKEWSNPEVFPKTIALGDVVSLGYGIKPPMQGEGMGRGKNCWVDDQNKVIGGKGDSPEQWEYFSKIPKTNVGDFKKFLKDKNIEVKDIRMSEKRGAVRQRDYKRTVEYKPPRDGDLNLVIQGCPAMVRLWEGNAKDMSHEARVALLSWALQTKNGLDLVREKFNHHPAAEEQIAYAIDTQQSPWSCKAIQDFGICVKGRDPLKISGKTKDKQGAILSDYCFERVPPRETIHGKIVINPKKIPEAEWAWPSPIRFRIPFKKTGAKALISQIDKLDEKDPDLADSVAKIYENIVELKDLKNRTKVIEYFKTKKLMQTSILKQFEKEAKETRREEKMREGFKRDGTRTLNGIHYTTVEGGGYATIGRDMEGNLILPQEICNFEIIIEKDIRKHSILGDDVKEFRGYIDCCGKKTPFKIATADWNNNSRLAEAIAISAGTEAVFKNADLDHVRAGVKLWGKAFTVSINSYEDYGFDRQKKPTVYRSKEWNITDQGYRSGEDAHADLSDGVFASQLNLREISKERFAEVVSIIKNDLLTMQDSFLTYTTIAHSLQATIHNCYIPFGDSPILWIQGLTGAGKSALSKFAQSFHGNFPRLLSIQSTPRSIEMYTMLFKDALLVLDDYKEAYYREGTIKLIQKIYDRSDRGRLGVNFKQSEAINCRGLVMVTAEDPPTSEASALSRLIYLESNHVVIDSKDNDIRFRRVEGAQKYFSGITGRFIHYMLQNYPQPEVIHEKFYEIRTALKDPIRDKNTQNSNRVVQNLAANYLTWELFCEFLQLSGSLSQDEFAEMKETHWKNVEDLRDSIITYCGREQASNVFLNIIRESLMSGKYRIDGFGPDNPHAEIIGFVDSPEAGEVCLFPSATVGLAKRKLREVGSALSHSKEAIGKQLLQDGMIKDRESGRSTKRKTYRGSREHIWCIDGPKAGLLFTVGIVKTSTPKKAKKTERDLSKV